MLSNIKRNLKNSKLVFLAIFILIYIIVYLIVFLATKKTRKNDASNNIGITFNLVYTPEHSHYIGRQGDSILFLGDKNDILYTYMKGQLKQVRSPIFLNNADKILNFCGTLVFIKDGKLFDYANHKIGDICSDGISDMYSLGDYLLMGCLNTYITKPTDWVYKMYIYQGEGCNKSAQEISKQPLKLKKIQTLTLTESIMPFGAEKNFIYFTENIPLLTQKNVYALDLSSLKLNKIEKVNFLQQGALFALKENNLYMLENGKSVQLSTRAKDFDCFIGFSNKFLYAKKENKWTLLYGKSIPKLEEALNTYIPGCDLIKQIYYGTNFIDIELNNDMILNIQKIK